MKQQHARTLAALGAVSQAPPLTPSTPQPSAQPARLPGLDGGPKPEPPRPRDPAREHNALLQFMASAPRNIPNLERDF